MPGLSRTDTETMKCPRSAWGSTGGRKCSSWDQAITIDDLIETLAVKERREIEW